MISKKFREELGCKVDSDHQIAVLNFKAFSDWGINRSIILSLLVLTYQIPRTQTCDTSSSISSRNSSSLTRCSTSTQSVSFWSEDQVTGWRCRSRHPSHTTSITRNTMTQLTYTEKSMSSSSCQRLRVDSALEDSAPKMPETAIIDSKEPQFTPRRHSRDPLGSAETRTNQPSSEETPPESERARTHFYYLTLSILNQALKTPLSNLRTEGVWSFLHTLTPPCKIILNSCGRIGDNIRGASTLFKFLKP